MMPVAIGSIVNDLNTQLSFIQAAMALHSLVMASTCLAAGKLATRLGEKRVFVAGALIFVTGVLVAAMSPSIWVLLLGWSLIKPIGGAMMIPAASSLIVLNYEGKQRSVAFGIFSAFVAAAAVVSKRRLHCPQFSLPSWARRPGAIPQARSWALHSVCRCWVLFFSA
jgi:MFS family permease